MRESQVDSATAARDLANAQATLAARAEFGAPSWSLRRDIARERQAQQTYATAEFLDEWGAYAHSMD